jgi:hypothetical protein
MFYLTLCLMALFFQLRKLLKKLTDDECVCLTRIGDCKRPPKPRICVFAELGVVKTNHREIPS